MVTLDASAASIQGKTKTVEADLENSEIARRLHAARNIDVPSIAQEQAGLVRNDLMKLGVSQEEEGELLIKQLTVTQLLLRAEITYRTIFGSQIGMPKRIVQVPNHYRLTIEGQTQSLRPRSTKREDTHGLVLSSV